MIDEEDERISAWHKIAAHPFFADAYGKEVPLIEAMLKELDSFGKRYEGATVQAEEPVEWRVLRAFSNGYLEGLRRGYEKGLDR